MKLPKDTYSVKRYEDLQFAVCQQGSDLHKNLWDLLVGAGLNRKQIFIKYTKILRETSQANHDILKSVGVRHFSFVADRKKK